MQPHNTRKQLRNLCYALGPYRHHYLLAVSLLVVSILFRSVEPKVLQLVVDEVIPLGGNAETAQPVAPVTSMAQFDSVHHAFPEDLDTLVGEKGVTLSGGQKQRVALARTLLDTPDVLILDDITSALDTQTEQSLFEALAPELKQKTSILISHRITSIQQADRVLVMDRGRLVQDGRPDELQGQAGYFRLIYRIQAGVETEISRHPSSP